MTGQGETAPERLDGRPVALALVAWASAWVATSGSREAWALAGSLLLGLAALGMLRRNPALVAIALVGALALGGGSLRLWQAENDPVRQLAAQGAVARVELVLTGGAREFAAKATRPASWVAPARLVRVEARNETWASGALIEVSVGGDTLDAWRALPLGARVSSIVTLGVPPPEEGLTARARARAAPTVVADPGPLDTAVQRVRAGLREACSELTPEARALVPALVVGDTGAMDPDLTARFKVVGLTHLTAVSGANLVLLLGFVRVVAVCLGVRGRGLLFVVGVTVFAFVALCLGEPSVVRAAAMGLVGLAALGRGGRGRQGLRYLAAAVLGLVVWDPWLARSLGFALSVTASAGLLLWAGSWAEVLRRWLPAWLAEAVATPLAAQLATQPIVTAVSGQVSVVGLLANAVAGPLVGPATVLGFAAAGASVVAMPVARLLAWLAGWCARGLCWIALIGSEFPGASVGWPATPPAVALVAVVCLLCAWLAPSVFARRWLSLAVALVMVATLLRQPAPPGWPPASWAVVACDVGQGDATLIRAGPQAAVLVDAGPDPALLRRCLDQLGVREVPLVFVTHLHADHVSGVPVLAGRRVGAIVTSGVRTPSTGEALVDALVAGGAEHVVGWPGAVWSVGEASFEVLAAPSTADGGGQSEGESSGENDASLALRVTVGGVSVVLAGDVEEAGQTRLLGLGERLKADVQLVPHHGSARQNPAFLAAVGPEIAVISVGAKNDYGHPTKKTLATLAGLTGNIVRTDQHGALAIARTDGHLTVTAQR